jgi:hypothetical protein
MFLGHYGVAFVAKKTAPEASLGTMFLAAQFVDLLWPLFLLFGFEHVRISPGITTVTPLDFYDYPYTHSLLGVIGWSLVLGVGLYVVRKDFRIGIVVALCTFSHWILDFIVHRPDLPFGLWGSTTFGLGLWNSVVWTLVVEFTLFLGGALLYWRSSKARDKVGSIGFLSLVLVLVGIYLLNLFGPPPPDERTIAIAGNAAWLFVLWAYWVDRHRGSRPATKEGQS